MPCSVIDSGPERSVPRAKSERPAWETSVEHPDGTKTSLSSSHLSPDELREVKQGIEAMGVGGSEAFGKDVELMHFVV